MNEIHIKEIIKNANERLFQKLNTYNDGLGDILISLLKKDKGIIAGSYILQCISNKNIEDCEIKLFFKQRLSIKGLENYYKAIEEKLKDAFGISIENTPFYNVPIIRNKFYGLLSGIMFEHLIIIGSLRIRIMTIMECSKSTDPINYQEDIIKHIKDTFELSLCKCWFDGYSIHSDDPIQQAIGKGTFDSDSIRLLKKGIGELRLRGEQKESFLKSLHNKTYGRIKKYEDRGFEIVISE